ncbi:hypothetical protein [Halalkalibacter krulwichiae]|uniref:Uncharacterized protein n=1 Tax=Halalkalibacter krulwichiae TaxID=199441 RepID=A0A1X9ME12_9BACI|nr:hypothetical protein [Halalkalibacter krulwichiae]ARK30770.1 hypothetical protein BkAM31D_13515 [Halalkalibacter krulwichiae]
MNITFFQYLTSDEKLSELLDHYPFEYKLKIFFGRPQAFSKEQLNEKGSFIDYPYIVYNVVPLSQREVANEHRVQVTLVTADEQQLNDITSRLIELLDFKKKVNDRPSNIVNNQIILNSQLMTGGSFLFHENEKVFEQNQYYLITLKG